MVPEGDMIVQNYLSNPILIDNYKFDLRVYVLVSSVDPLRVFIYKEGLARFATEPYSNPGDTNLNNVCMHLTNYAINKNSTKFDHSGQKYSGSKRSLRSVLEILNERHGVNINVLWAKICDVIVKTLLIVQRKCLKLI